MPRATVIDGRVPHSLLLEVSTDQAFGKLDASKTGIAAGSGGRTSVTLDKLAGGKTYYWRTLVTAPAWPAHPAWLGQFLKVLGTSISHSALSQAA